MANINISQLTAKQKYALDLMMNGENVFLTGEAGTGKSEVVKFFIQAAADRGDNILVTAPTGTAADNLHGETIHRCFGANIGVQKNNRALTERNQVMKAADIIIIDEISMCRFDLFEYVARRIAFENDARKRDLFNRDLGVNFDEDLKEKDIQLIVLGDFYQLPPVITPDDAMELSQTYKYDYGKGYAFKSTYWELLGLTGVVLTEIVRQDDKAFKNILSEIRRDDRNSKNMCIDFLMRNSSTFPMTGDDAVTLVPTNKKCKEINDRKLAELTTVNEKTYSATVTGDINNNEKFAEDEITLKDGCKVMLTVNAPGGEFVNGTIGIVKKMRDESIDVLTEDGKLITVGKTIKEITRPVAKTKMVKKMVKEAITKDGVPVNDVNGNVIMHEVMKDVEESTIVHETVGSFTQLPVRVAYAITIHKSQGKTFNKINLDPYAWDDGQFYTALSRGKKIENIFFMQEIRPKYIKTSPDVKAFMKPLEKASASLG